MPIMMFTGALLMAASMLKIFSSGSRFLIVLVFLEVLMVGNLMILVSIIRFWSIWMVLMVALIVAACEASLGLTLLVTLLRSHGEDYVLLYGEEFTH